MGTFLEVLELDLARDLQRLRRAAGLRPLRGNTGRTPFLEALSFEVHKRRFLMVLWPFWGRLGVVFGRLGAVLGRLGAILASRWV